MLRNGFYNVIGATWRMALSVVTVPLLIRLIGVEVYGVWVLVMAGIGVVALAEAGLSISTTVFVSQDLAKSDREGLAQTLTVTIGAMLILATLAGAVYAGSAIFYPSLFPDLTQAQRETMGQAMIVGGVVIWAQLMQRVLIGVEQAYQRYAVLNGIITIEVTLRSVGLLAIAAAGGGIVEFMQWQAVVSSGALLVHSAVVWRLLPRSSIRPMWNGVKGRMIARYSVLTWVSSIGGTSVFSITSSLDWVIDFSADKADCHIS